MYWVVLGAFILLVISMLVVGGLCLARERRRPPWSATRKARLDENRRAAPLSR
ncbi:MAG TPA: hypothetical protein VEI03_10095 [Stellaceae bacterium]|nr:hypothetical protein [Stellaceae bacterium]